MKKILIIEDDEKMANYLGAELSKAGFSPTKTIDAYQGYQAVSNLKPDLIILDLMLPAGNGMDLLRKVRASFQIQAIPVIIITAFQDDEARNEAEEIGVQGYFKKPFESHQLIEKIKSLLNPEI